MPEKTLGLDIGTDTIKVVQVTGGARDPRVTAFTTIGFKGNEELENSLREICEDDRLRSDTTVSSIDSASFFYRNLKMPFSDPKKIRKIVPFDLEPFIPIPIEQLLVDYLTVFQGDKTDIFAAAVERRRIRSHLEALQTYHVEPNIVDVEGVPLAVSIIEKIDTSDGIVLDIGNLRTTLVLWKDKTIHLVRSLPFGGNDITQAISEQLHIDPEEAERIKCSLGETKSPLPPLYQRGETTESPPFLGETTESPPFLGETTESPSFLAETTESPPFLGETTESPPFLGETTESPPFLGETTESPPFLAETTESPPFLGETTESPPFLGETTESPPFLGETTESPPFLGETTESPPFLKGDSGGFYRSEKFETKNFQVSDDETVDTEQVSETSEKLDTINDVIGKELVRLCGMVENTIRAFSAQQGYDYWPDKIYLNGGGVLVPEAKEIISRHLETSVEHVDLKANGAVRIEGGDGKEWRPALMNNAVALALRGNKKGRGFNFRQEEFEVRGSLTRYKKEIVSAIAAFAVIIACIVANAGTDFYLLKKKYEKLNSAVVQVFKDTLPDVKRIVNPVQQLKVGISEEKTKKGLVPGSEVGATVVDILRDISVLIPGSIDFKIDTIVFDPDMIQINGDTDNFNTVDSIKNGLQKSSYFGSVDISSAKLDSSGTRVEFKVILSRRKG
jgi:type II secretory pathway component PulL